MNLYREEKSDPRSRLVLLSGFLGAGKTTLLRTILSGQTDMADTCVIVNEFGAVGIDGARVASQGIEVIELTSGCVCCTLAGDLKKTLMNVAERFGPRRILLESSGVADPFNIAAIFKDESIAEVIVLHRRVAVLDIDCWPAREILGPLFFRQLETADLILLNKIDVLDPETVRVLVAEIETEMPRAEVLPTVYCRIDPDRIWKPDIRGRSVPAATAHPGAAPAFVSFSFQKEEPLDSRGFNDAVAGLPPGIFRIKGPVRLEAGTRMFDYVGGKISWSAWTGTPGTCLAFVGWQITAEDILARFRNCIIDASP